MSEFKGYTGRSLDFLRKEQVRVGDSVKVHADLTYTGIVMPRYEHADDRHIVVKLKSGYNVGLELEKIGRIERIEGRQAAPKAAGAEPKEDPGLPNILLLSTGGTIASRIDYRTGAVTPTMTAQELNDSIPELAQMANIRARSLFSEYSENIVPQHWLKIAEAVREYAASEYAGIIIAHGTDTMHYTSAFLSFALAGFPIPVALVGSQRSSDRASSDAALNMIGATRFLADSGASGVYVVMHHDENDEAIACHIGTRVRKNHASKRGAFKTIGGDPAFLVVGDRVHRNMEGRFFTAGQFTPNIALDERVALVKYHPGFSPGIMDAVVDSDCRAIIFEGTGLGHVGRKMYPAVKRAAEKGIFMGMTSQCIDGRVRMTVYESGRDLLNMGIVPLEDMMPETATVKAMWAAGIAQDLDGIRDLMLSKTASEFSA